VGRAFDLRRQCSDACITRGALGPAESGARHLRPQASNCDPGKHQLMGGLPRRWKRRRVEFSEHTLGLVEAADQKQAPDREMPRMSCIDVIAVRFERGPRCLKRLWWPAQVA
jgi:hypothetical protein